jgi:hypothetical protein
MAIHPNFAQSIFKPSHASGLLQTEEARPQNIDGEMMQERRQFILSVPGDGFSYATLRL